MVDLKSLIGFIKTIDTINLICYTWCVLEKVQKISLTTLYNIIVVVQMLGTN